MAHLIKIGNSQGIRIPKPLIEQVGLEDRELTIQVLNGGIFVAPVHKIRAGWMESIAKVLANGGSEEIDIEWLNAELTSDEDLEW